MTYYLLPITRYLLPSTYTYLKTHYRPEQIKLLGNWLGKKKGS